jgi:hypothetical protein
MRVSSPSLFFCRYRMASWIQSSIRRANPGDIRNWATVLLMVPIFALPALLALPVYAQGSGQVVADVATVISVEGSATLKPSGKATSPKAIKVSSAEIEAYTRLRTGDSIVLPASASISVGYFATGLVEVWRGPAQLTIGRVRSDGGKASPVETRQIPEAILARTERAGALLGTLRNRTGATIAKSFETDTPALADARKDLATLTSTNQKPNTPSSAAQQASLLAAQLGVVVGLLESERYAEAQTLLTAMLARQPKDPLLLGLLKETQRLSGAPAKP